jgi:hypothetical protein
VNAKQAAVLEFYQNLNLLMRETSHSSTMLFSTLPSFPAITTEESAEVYLKCIRTMTNNLPPSILIKKGEILPVISMEI